VKVAPNHDKIEVMRSVEEIAQEIFDLPADQEARLMELLLEKDQQRWDHQLDADSAAGKLDFLIAEVKADIAAGRITPFPEKP
jgi:hypothetical protein